MKTIMYGMPKIMKGYIPLKPLFDKPSDKLSEVEAEQYFKWYVSHANERSEYIKKYISKVLNIPISEIKDTLDTIQVIEEFIKSVATVKKPPLWKRIALTGLIMSGGATYESSQEGVETLYNKELTEFSDDLAKDVGMYIENIFIKSSPELRWDRLTTISNDIDYYPPGVFGFCSKKLISNEGKENLLEISENCFEYNHYSLSAYREVTRYIMTVKNSENPLYDDEFSLYEEMKRYFSDIPERNKVYNENYMLETIYGFLNEWDPANIKEIKNREEEYRKISNQILEILLFPYHENDNRKISKKIIRLLKEHFGSKQVKSKIDKTEDFVLNINEALFHTSDN